MAREGGADDGSDNNAPEEAGGRSSEVDDSTGAGEARTGAGTGAGTEADGTTPAAPLQKVGELFKVGDRVLLVHDSGEAAGGEGGAGEWFIFLPPCRMASRPCTDVTRSSAASALINPTWITTSTMSPMAAAAAAAARPHGPSSSQSLCPQSRLKTFLADAAGQAGQARL